MKRTIACLIATLAVVIPCPGSVSAQSRSRNKLIDALASAPALVTYIEDGAADASVTNVDANSPLACSAGRGLIERPCDLSGAATTC